MLGDRSGEPSELRVLRQDVGPQVDRLERLADARPDRGHDDPLPERLEHRIARIDEVVAEEHGERLVPDVVLRNQAEQNIREAAPTLAYAEKVIRRLYREGR